MSAFSDEIGKGGRPFDRVTADAQRERDAATQRKGTTEDAAARRRAEDEYHARTQAEIDSVREAGRRAFAEEPHEGNPDGSTAPPSLDDALRALAAGSTLVPGGITSAHDQPNDALRVLYL